MLMIIILLIAHSDLLMVNGGGHRVARSPLDPHPNCEAGVLTNTYSEFILREQVTIGPGDQPQKDGVVCFYISLIDMLQMYEMFKLIKIN